MKPINRVAVLGAGTMGAGIAAHLANAGRAVLLLDAVPSELTAAESSRGLTLSHPQVRNRLALAGLERLKTSRPAGLYSPAVAAQITPGNVEDDLARLADVDWIIEAVTERLEVKQSLLARVEAVRRPGTIVSSNTSGLPIGQVAEGRSAEFKQHVLGTHFFNPPRQMKLLEVTPIPETLPDVVETISQVGERDLGKGVVICKDTPNFIGNRIFTFDLTFGLLYALQHGYTIEEVDLLTGPLIGRPRTATFRLLDLVGIDVMALVSVNLYPRLPDDETREILRSTESASLIGTMVERRWLGNKTGIGFYKQVGAGSAREYWPLDLATLEHRPPQKPQFPALAGLERERDLGARLRALVALDDRAGHYLRAILGNLLGYTSRRLPEIADDVRSIDDAMRWGFSHALGPFEIWDRLGIPEGQRLASADDVPGGGAAAWVDQLLATGRRSFYEPAATPGRAPSYWNVAQKKLIAPADSTEALSVAGRKAAGGTVFENASASLVDLGDGVAALQLHTKLNTLDDLIVELIGRSVEKVASDFRALVVTGQGEHFSAGANVGLFAGAIEAKDWSGIDRAGRAMQDVFMALRFSPRPVVVAPVGWALGGAAELMMSGARIVAAGETYIGQVEVGVGLLPGAGGCKELLRRIVSPVASQPPADTLPALSRVLELMAQGKVSSSALEAREWGFLSQADRIVMNPDHLLAAAKREALALADDYRPPSRGKNVYAAGRDALAALKIQIYLFRESAYASAHDAEIARQMAYVLCGGELSEPQWVDEQYILNLERSAFVALCQLPKTQERIKHFLATGRTLRN